MDLKALAGYQAWNDATQRVLDLQAQWKEIGFAPQKMNAKIFERFRAACDMFFARKAEFFKNMKDSLSVNLEKKIALCEQAEALKAFAEQYKGKKLSLVAEASRPGSKEHNQRLSERRLERVMKDLQEVGFAEEDLKLRGPGDIDGTQQSGLPINLKIAHLVRDVGVMEKARECAKKMLLLDPQHTLPANAVMWKHLKEMKKESNFSEIS